MMSRRALGVLVALLAAAPVAAQSIPVAVGGNASSLVGVPFQLPIEVDLTARADKLGAVAFRLAWNPAVLEFLGGEAGAFGDLTVNDDSLAAGVLRASGVNPGGVSGRFSVATGWFRPLVADTTTLGLTVQQFYAAGTFADLLSSVVVSSRQYCPALGRWGDVDGDGAANSRDALITLSAAVGLPVGSFNAGLGDVDADGAPQARDALIILSYSVGLSAPGSRLMTIAAGPCGVTIAALAIDPGVVELLVGQRASLLARASDGGGAAVAAQDVFWSSSNPDIAAVGPDGTVVGVAAGTATVRAVRAASGDTAQATVNVVATRGTHWVNALAVGARNPLGSSAHPFPTIVDAMARARPGDTIRVLPGRYAESVTVNRPVVLWGDTTGGATAPLVGDATAAEGIRIQTAGRAEVHNLRIDSAPVGVFVTGSDSVRLVNLLYRGPYYGQAGIEINFARRVLIERTRLYGAVDYYYSSDGVVSYADNVHLEVRGSEVTGFGYNGIAVYNADSVHVEDSRVTNNYYVGILVEAYDSTRAFGTVLRRNHVAGNYYGQVEAYLPRRLVMEHNALGGGGGYYYDLLALYGYGATVASLRGDSLSVFGGGYWISADTYDSLTMDSVTVDVRQSYGTFYDGRRTVITNSLFTNITYDAVDYYGYYNTGTDDRLIVQNSTFEGPPAGECSRCGDGLYVDGIKTELTDVTFRNLYRAFWSYDSTTTATRVTVSDVWYGLYQSCGSMTLDSVMVTAAGSEAIDFYGCDATDTLSINRSTIQSVYYAIDGYDGTLVLRNSELEGSGAVYWYGYTTTYFPTVRIDSSVLRSRGSTAVYLDLNDSLTAITVRDNAVQCLPGATQGVNVQDAAVITVERNQVSGCRQGIFAGPSSSLLPLNVPVRIAGNRIDLAPGGFYGVQVGGARAMAAIVADTVTGGASDAAIDVYNAGARVRIDSNVVRHPRGRGIHVVDGDTVHIRANDLLDTATAPSGTNAAIFHEGGSATFARVEITDNRIHDSRTHGIRLERYSTLDTTHVRVERNVVRGVDSLGLFITEYAKADVFNNTIDSAGTDALRIDRFDNDTTSVRVHDNNFTNSAGAGLANYDGWSVHATSNWWGDALGPGGVFGDTTGASVGDSVTTLVAWDPWLTAPAAGAPLSAPPAFLAAMPVPLPLSFSAVADAAAPPERSLRVRPVRGERWVLPMPAGLPDVVRARRAAEQARAAAPRPERRERPEPTPRRDQP